MASILDENPGFVGSFCDDKPSKEEKLHRRHRREKLEKAMEKRANFSEADFAAEEARIAEQIAEWERTRDAA
ncbi:hypothetical protein Ga0609869_000029 [Rhodovulum iodosum]|uniref:Uncharacterized protein n=1 Tax=Rhodovulum iodosum TaxID=68291 RepID=A0ABV3XMY8_9RHOB|nr:hypothetical protein [Rhodovulum robiginosum]RSK35819.1 hypothetical protein EJA01_05575 [Rhodovulum robiginosum]